MLLATLRQALSAALGRAPVVLLSLALVGAPGGAQKSAVPERDLNAIVEEQALLARQLERLSSA